MKKLIGIPMLFLGGFALASFVSAGEASLTRFGPIVVERAQGAPAPESYSAEFRAIEGPAELVLQDFGISNAQIKVNDEEVVVPNGFRGNGEIVVPLYLNATRTVFDPASGVVTNVSVANGTYTLYVEKIRGKWMVNQLDLKLISFGDHFSAD